MKALTRFQPGLLSLLRVMAGLLILQHGTAKVLNFPTSPLNDVPLSALPGIAGILELIFGALLVIGLYTRISAFVLSGVTAAAYFIAHTQQGFYPLLNGGELAALYSFTFLFIAAAGAGPISLDAARKQA
ncbi:MAG: DoxX family protein [Qingshengfaniella sp.]